MTCCPALGENYVVALNLASTVPHWLEKLRARPMLLGLDLQGGVHFLLQVDQKAALDKRFEAYAEDMRVALRDNRVGYESVERRSDGSIVATLSAGRRSPSAQARDRQGDADAAAVERDGNIVTVRVPEAEVNQIVTDAIEQNVGTLRNRINELGVAEPIIQRQGTDRVVVELPGVQDTARPSASSAPPRRWNTAAWSTAMPTTRSPAAACRRKRACITARNSARTASRCRSCSASA